MADTTAVDTEGPTPTRLHVRSAVKTFFTRRELLEMSYVFVRNAATA